MQIGEAAAMGSHATEVADESEDRDREPTTRHLNLRIVGQRGEALPNARYLLLFADEEREGTTDGDGILREETDKEFEEAILRVIVDDRRVLTWRLGIGDLPPMESNAGVRARLGNLGWRDGVGARGVRVSTCLGGLQRAEGLERTGTVCDDTRNVLRREHAG